MSEEKPVHALNLDAAQQQSFVRYYRSLPEKPGVTVRFFNRSDFYTVHGDDATFAVQHIYGTHTIKQMGDEPTLSYLVLSRGNFEKFVRELLLVRQYRVEVYTKPSQSKNQEWLLEYKGSPGNIAQFEQILFDNNEVIFNTSVLAINIVRANTIAVGCVNATECQFFVSEFTDNEGFTELEALMAQINPKECIIPSGDSSDLITLTAMLDRSGILIAKLKKSEFSSNDIVQDLDRLLYFSPEQKRSVTVLPEINLTNAMGCLQAAIKYLNLVGDEQNFNQFKLNNFNVHRFIRLDGAAMVALNLLPKPGTSTVNNASSKYTSVLGMLDRCCTPQGHRLLEQWIRQPLRDLNLINERLEAVHALVKDAETRDMLYSNHLTRVPDLLMVSKKLSNKKGSLQDCYRVYQTVSNVAPMITVLRDLGNSSVKAMLTGPMSDLLTDLENYQSMIEQILDLDLVDRGEYFIKPSFHPELQALSKRKEVLEEKMQKALRRTAQDLGHESGKSIKLEWNELHGYFYRITLKEEHSLRENRKYRIIDAIKGGVRFTDDALSELNEEYSEIKSSYEEHQKNVVQEIFEIAAGYTDTFRNLNLYIAKVDVLVSFANVAANAPVPFVKPKVLDEGSGVLKLKRVRHPCLELQDGVTFIPNDVEFKKDERLLHVITGSNMGGKSTYIRSIGVAVLLAHIGSFVPCAEAEISLVDSILARVGASDSEIKGLSTFMLEMVETSSIIKSGTPNSLVIIDELGRGTSTYDGFGIAWSIAEHLATQTKCFSLFATHFHELTQLANQFPTINNWHMTCVTTETTITPLYQVREGACDKSYGIHCARMAGFPLDVIDRAIHHLRELEDYEGMKFIIDFEPILKRKVIEEGDEQLKKAFEECKQLDLNNLSDEELMLKTKKIKAELLSHNNLFVQGLLGD